MKKTAVIIASIIVLCAVYKMQHVRPVDDPEDTPIFQQRLQNSLDRFQEYEFPARQGFWRLTLRKRNKLGLTFVLCTSI